MCSSILLCQLILHYRIPPQATDVTQPSRSYSYCCQILLLNEKGGRDLLTPHISSLKHANVRRSFNSAKLRESALNSAKAREIIPSHFVKDQVWSCMTLQSTQPNTTVRAWVPRDHPGPSNGQILSQNKSNPPRVRSLYFNCENCHNLVVHILTCAFILFIIMYV